MQRISGQLHWLRFATDNLMCEASMFFKILLQLQAEALFRRSHGLPLCHMPQQPDSMSYHNKLHVGRLEEQCLLQHGECGFW